MKNFLGKRCGKAGAYLLFSVLTTLLLGCQSPAEVSNDEAVLPEVNVASSATVDVKPAPFPQATAALAAASKASSAKSIKLATWNMHDFFDTIDDSNNDEVLTPQEYNDKVARASVVLRQLNADIVGVQEVEKESCLKSVAAKCGYKYTLLVKGNDVQRGIKVGCLSRLPIKNHVSHARDLCTAPGINRRGGFSRDCLEIHFDHPSRFTLLVNHLKSQRGKKQPNDEKRLAQAYRIREIAQGLQKFPVAICGDLNADPDSASLAPLMNCSFLTDIFAGTVLDQRLTFVTKRYHSALDYILVNKALKPAVVPGSAHILANEAVQAASDHRPVSVVFNLAKLSGQGK